MQSKSVVLSHLLFLDVVKVKAKHIKVINGSMQRTSQQNRAMHKLFADVAEALDREGHTVQDVTKAIRRAEIRITPEIVKEVIWKPLQQVMYGKESTTELEKHELDRVYEVLNKWLGDNFNGLCVDFPSREQENNELLQAIELSKKIHDTNREESV